MKEYISTTEAAKILKISRIAVFYKIRDGLLPAQRFGRNYLIKPDDITRYLVAKQKKARMTLAQRKEIDTAVQKVIDEYGETIKALGDN